MKIAIKNKSELRYVDAESITINGERLDVVFNKLDILTKAYEQLTEELKDCYIVKKDTKYLVDIDGEVKRVSKLKIHENVNTSLNLRLYEIREGKLVPNKRKVGSL